MYPCDGNSSARIFAFCEERYSCCFDKGLRGENACCLHFCLRYKQLEIKLVVLGDCIALSSIL